MSLPTTAEKPQVSEHNALVSTGTEAALLVSSKTLSIIADINESHRLALSHRDSAVEHAIRCGELLLEQKARLEHGEFINWIKTNCTFAQSTATRYMAAAKQKTTGVAISSLSALFPSGQPGATRQTTPNTPVSTDDQCEKEPVKAIAAPQKVLPDSASPKAWEKKKALTERDGKPALVETITLISTAMSTFYGLKDDYNLDFKSISPVEAADLALRLETAMKSMERLRKALTKRCGGRQT